MLIAPTSLAVKSKARARSPSIATPSDTSMAATEIQHRLMQSIDSLQKESRMQAEDIKLLKARLVDVEGEVGSLKRRPLSDEVARKPVQGLKEIESVGLLKISTPPPPPPPPPPVLAPSASPVIPKPSIKKDIATEVAQVAAAAEPSMVDVLKELSRVQKKLTEIILPVQNEGHSTSKAKRLIDGIFYCN
ncbi:hypothetical protein HDU67_008907 [Dinochytrium kinnereticum]|nr:hypothetical protein HDU67_008907 [Dinochytrium kinnereticum]